MPNSTEIKGNWEEFKGKLNYANIKIPYMYERVQFMKYFSSYK